MVCRFVPWRGVRHVFNAQPPEPTTYGRYPRIHGVCVPHSVSLSRTKISHLLERDLVARPQVRKEAVRS